VKGLPISYVDGHQNRRPDQTHIVQDCGYETPCWIWQGAQIRGYGRAGRAGLAHRVYFEKEHGPLPSGTQLHHLCEQRLCVNPAHLAPLVQSEHRRRHNRLSDADVLAIREHAAAGARVVDIAGAYEISATGVTRIIHGSTYRHVGGPLVTTELRGLRRDTRRISREADEL
jgi:hypothetical protein